MIYRLETMTSEARQFQLSVHKYKLASISFSSGSRKIATSGQDKDVKIIAIERNNAKEINYLRGHDGVIYKTLWDPKSNEKLMSISLDKTIRFWDLRASKSAVQIIKTEEANLNACWASDGRTVAVADAGDNISFIDIRGGNRSIVNTIKHEEFVFGMAWDWRTDLFYRTMGDGSVNILHYPSMEILHTFQAHSTACLSIAFDPKGRYFATGGGDAIASVWDLDTFLCKSTAARMDGSIKSLSFSCDGEMLASSSLEEPSIDLCHSETGEWINTVKMKNNPTCFSFAPTENVFAYSCDDYGRDRGSLHIMSLNSS